MTDPEAVPEARRSLGKRLAAYRRANGYNQTKFAPLTGYGRSTVANVETGRQSPPRDFWQRCDAILSTGGVLTAAYDEIEAAVREQRLQAARTNQAARAAQARQVLMEQPDAVPMGCLWPETVEHAREEVPKLWAQDLSAPSFEPGESPTMIALRWLVAPPDLMIAHVAGWQRVGIPDVERLRAIRHTLKSLDNAHGGGTPRFPWR